jgi:inosose dehydratase
MMPSRRNFIRLSGLGVAASAMPSVAFSAMQSRPENKVLFQLGVASYSLRKFPVEKALDMTRKLDLDFISFKDFHLPLNADVETFRKTLQMVSDRSMTLYGGGVIYMKTEAEVDRAFEYAKNAKFKMIIGVPNHELLPYVEKKVKQYDIMLAIHNHGPGDKLYPSAESAYVLIKDMDKRMGLCIDIGHTKRIDRDPSDDLKDYFDRVLDVHIKDVTEATAKGSTCEVGRGVIDIPRFLQTLIDLKYNGIVALEFEKDADDPLPGMAESIGYTRGVLEMLTRKI